MAGLYKSILNLKYFKLSLFFIFVTVGAIVYFTFVSSEPNDSRLLAEDEELHPVSLGDVRRQVSINGRLVFPTKEALNFASQGVVTDISVVEGQLVTKGDLLAKLDTLTIKGLERDVAKLALDLQLAEDLLEEGREGISDLKRAHRGDHGQQEQDRQLDVDGHDGKRCIRGLQSGQEASVANCGRQGVRRLFQQICTNRSGVVGADDAGDARVRDTDARAGEAPPPSHGQQPRHAAQAFAS